MDCLWIACGSLLYKILTQQIILTIKGVWILENNFNSIFINVPLLYLH